MENWVTQASILAVGILADLIEQLDFPTLRGYGKSAFAVHGNPIEFSTSLIAFGVLGSFCESRVYFEDGVGTYCFKSVIITSLC
jgi:hypothetical protein